MPLPIPPTFATPRAAIMAVFAAFGAAVGVLAGSIPTVSKAADVDSFTLGLAITASTLMTVIVMSSGGVIARHASQRAILLAVLPAFALVTILFLVSHSAVAFFVSLVMFGAAAGLTDVFMNAEGAAIEQDLGRPVFTAFHGCVSIGLPVFALLSSFLSVEVGPWATGFCVAVLFAIAWLLVRRSIVARPPAFGRAARISSLPNKTPLVLLGLTLGLVIAGETAAILWSAKLLDEQAPALASVAGVGAAFFGLCTAVIRFQGDGLRAKFGDVPLMIASLSVATAGFAILGLSHVFALSVFGFALVGLGTAMLTPCIFTLAAAFVPANRAAGISFISMMAGAPRTLAPWLFGWTAAAAGISAAFGLYAGVMAMALTLVVILRNLR